MPACTKCGEIIGSGHLCRRCQEEFLTEIEEKGREKAYILTAFAVIAAVAIFSRMPKGTVSKVLSDASSSSRDFIPAVINILEKIKEPTSMIDIQFRMIFAAVIFALVASFALLTIARRGF